MLTPFIPRYRNFYKVRFPTRRQAGGKSLLLTTALAGLVLPNIASAESTASAPHRHADATVGHVEAKPSRKAEALRPVKAAAGEDILVSVARRAHGTMISVGEAQIQRAVPGTNPLKVLGQAPGVMFQSADPQGLDVWSTQIYMHGFMQNQISTTLDDVPLGELTYRNYNGLNPIQAISSENVQRVDVSTGAGAESVASTNNLGGSLEYQSSSPKDKVGGQVVQTFGSYDLFHTFIRADSGKLNESGTKFFVSYMRNDTQKWKGGGNQFSQQVNAKLVQPVGEESKITAYFDWSDLHEYLYQDYSLDIMNNGGYNIDNYYNGRYSGYVNAYNAALGHYPANFSGISDKADAAYYDGAANINDYLGYLQGDFKITDRLRWKTTVYGHGQTNALTWTNPFYASPTGSPMFEQVKQPSIQRFGILSAAHYDIAHNHIEAGVWYENNQFNSTMYGYAEPALGQGAPLNAVDSFHTRDAFMQLFGQHISTNTFTAYAQDTYNIMPNLALHFGFKSLLNTSNAGNGYYNNAYYGDGEMMHGSLTTFRAFLPHISGDWHFLKHHELYFDIAENVHAYPQAQFKTAASPYAQTEASYLASSASLKPESDWAYAIGYRYSSRIFDASVHAYRINFFNRLQQITTGNIVNPVATVMNVGNITTNGVDAAITLRPVNGLSWTNSISYNHSTYDNNLNSQGVTYHTKGQQVVAYPRIMYKTSAIYDYGPMEATIDASWTSQRNLSYTGDAKVPSYWMSNFGLRYRFGNLGKYAHALNRVENLDLSFNIYNLNGAKYVSTMGENGFPLSGDFQSFLVGAPRMFFGSIKVSF
ncbi:TonB-dependent receptor plug domain-containing protein [Acetobacter sp. TBRC 12305]|uniref:TonB-dependent receptor plug domain-containing protein n=1 Tax=Acetobacter garciniae TaxID=2817435 RepID=A0A939KRB2_9PROT|nr:TonB-dependent receptor [Acetobacter garciniae]MBO1324836.1 TonB-dependent receptor plug domain-containing protein [Acetobacter garciniae]MBX0344527.1 TonB-dependent receptor plug domain-containing protein [Acetobacter garciniae]